MRYVANIAINGDKMASVALDALGVDQMSRATREADRYELHVLELIARINQADSGRAVLRAIRRQSNRMMMIQPYVGKAINAKAKAVDLKAATRKRRRVGGRGSDRGTGTGSDTDVFFSSGYFKKSDIKPLLGIPNPPKMPGILPDEVLLHEMFHGLRHMAGLRRTRRVPFQPGYDTMEEFFAILIANLYSSECGRKGLRLDHRTSAFSFVSEADFLKIGRNRAHLRQLRRQQSALFADLQRVNAPFNPTRLLVEV